MMVVAVNVSLTCLPAFMSRSGGMAASAARLLYDGSKGGRGV